MAESHESAVEPAPDAVPASPQAEVQAAEAEFPAPGAPDAGPERVLRGILFSLLIIPAGVLAWAIIWQLGFMSAIVAFGVAVGGAWLYRFGSGGRMGVVGIVCAVACPQCGHVRTLTNSTVTLIL